MKRKSQEGFTLVEMIIVIVVIGIIGSMAATMLFQGAKTCVGDTDRQGFVSESRSAFWRIMRDTQGQASPIAQLVRFDGKDLEGKSSQVLRTAKVLGKSVW